MGTKKQRKSSKLKIVVQVLLAVLFGLFAYVQLNDADGVLWFLIYGGVTIVHLFAAFKRIPKMILRVLILGLSGYSLVHLPYFWEWLHTTEKSEIFGEMVYEKPYLEGTREFLGLLIALISLLFLIRGPKK